MNWNKFLNCVILGLSLEILYVEGFLGINWGRLATQRMIPSMVVDLLMQNKINDVKIFSSSDNVMEAFGGTPIGLTITMSNGYIRKMKSLDDAKTWVFKSIKKYSDVNITHVLIGTLPFSRSLTNETFPEAIQALEWTQIALNSEENRNIKAIMSQSTDILIPVKKPSEGAFNENIKDLVSQSCKILQRNKSPIGLDFIPLLSVNNLFNNDTEFAFIENNSTSGFQDGNNTYSNILEVMYDMYDVALEKVGCPNMTIFINSIGWPTDGMKDGNIVNAQRFHQEFAKFITGKKGTPRRPGPIDAYLQSLADENKANFVTGSYLRHLGIYQFDGQPKFNFDLQGFGRDTKLVPAIGITHMPKRWCIFNEKFTSFINKTNTIETLYQNACNFADCTVMDPGGSCSNLTYIQKLSYALNVAFQRDAQTMFNKSCDFNGYAKIVSEDPSTPSCLFPVEIIAAEIPNYNGNIQSSYALKPSARSLMIAILQILMFFFSLISTCRKSWI